MEREIHTLLEDYGLSEKEISIYLYLVRNNKLTAYKIAKDVKIHRSTSYDVLERLRLKGFISLIEENGKRYYVANEIGSIITKLKDRENILVTLIPKIQKLEQKEDKYVKLLDNSFSQKEFTNTLLDLVKRKKLNHIYVLGPGPSSSSKLSSNLFIERIVREVVSKKLVSTIDFRAIWDLSLKESKFFSLWKNLGENRFLKLPTETTTVVFDGYVAFLYTDEEPEVIEIKNKKVSEEMKVYFEHLWKSAKK